MWFLKWLRRNKDKRVKESDWVIVAHATGPAIGEILAGVLRTANIPHYVHQETVGRVIGLSIGTIGMVTIHVPQAYEKEAIALLDDPTLDDYPPQIDEPSIKF